jgi:hypothetical protein
MNLEITSRQRPGRRGFIGGSDGHFIVSAEKAASIPLWKEERGEAESKGHRASSRLRISATRRHSRAQGPSLHPVSSVVRWLFKLFVFLLKPGSRSRTPTPPPVSGIKTNPAASIADRNFSTLLSRESRLVLKSIDGDRHACCGRKAGGAPVKIGTSHAALNRATW